MTQIVENGEDTPIHVLEIAGNAIVGGMEKYVYNITQQLPYHQFKVTCVAPYESAFTSSLRSQGSEVFITPMDNDPPWRSIQFICELVKHHHIDLIHAHLPKAHVLAGLVGKLTNVPAVATIHGMDLSAHELGISRTTSTNMIVVCYDAYAQALNLGIPDERLSLIPNGVDLKTYTPNRGGVSFRKAIHVPLTDPLIGLVGRLAWEKGPDLFIFLADHIHRQLPNIHFVIVGEGPMEAELINLIRELHLENFVHLAGQWTNTWEVYPSLDLLVQTSRVEGMPFALLEGMASGRPIAAIGVGGVPEIVEVGTCGVLSAPGDWKGLADAIVDLVPDTDRLKEMGHASRKRIEESFDLQRSIRLTANLFRRILGKKLPKGSSEELNWLRMHTMEKPQKGDVL